ncbi:hypothetical protein [Okeania sp.]|uniref:hypothetical protein n=1 Tax=Okeania sp. TaxID=3100323 RepID=UPI002B4ABBDF|nr:hypothetical protein [Okeania sp.]MEB3342664.1 hypothetical protein [Okeania sp.]
MNKPSSLVTTVILTSMIAISVNVVGKAQESAQFECIQKYTNLGVSPDTAVSECNKQIVGNCIRKLIGQRVVATSILYSEEEGYLIDLGNEDSSWLEGGSWKDKGCVANTVGPYKRQSDQRRTFWNNQRSYEWFRQGWCQEPEIVLDKTYSPDEAKILCEAGYTGSNTTENQPTESTFPDNSTTENKSTESNFPDDSKSD